jgi:hypothetical protein
MKKLVVLLMAMLIATSAFAIVDPDDNMMGIYFDLEADNPCIDGAAPYSTHEIYLVLTNMVADAVYGFEAGYTIEGAGMVLSTAFANPTPIDVGSAGNHIVGFGSPTMAGANGVTLLATLTVMYMDTAMGPLNFDLHGTIPSSIDPMYPVILLEGGVLLSVGLSAAEGPAAQFNGGCEVVATDNVSFDGIKSLYR